MAAVQAVEAFQLNRRSVRRGFLPQHSLSPSWSFTSTAARSIDVFCLNRGSVRRGFLYSPTVQAVELAFRLLADGIVRSQGAGLFQGGTGAGLVAGPSADEAEGQPDALEIRGLLGAGAENLQGPGGLTAVVEGQAEVVAGVRVGGVEFQGATVVVDGLLVTSLAEELVPGVVNPGRVLAGQRDGRGANRRYLALDEGGWGGARPPLPGRSGCRARRRPERVAQVIIPGQGKDGEAVEEQKDGEKGPLQGAQSGHGGG